jgi:putative lipoprotein
VSRVLGFSFFLLLLAAIALISLKSMRPIAASAALADVTDIDWSLVSLGDATIPTGSRLTLRFEAGGKLSGHGGCNDFFANYTVSGAGIAIGAIGATRKACAAPQMALETRFLDMLGKTSSIEMRGTTLALSGPDGEVLAAFERVSTFGRS